MTISANTIIVHGTMDGNTLYANTLSAPESMGAINVMSDLKVSGNVMSEGRLETGKTIFGTMRAAADFPMLTNEHFITGYDMVLDPNASDAASLMSVMPNQDILSIWDWVNGKFIVPADGFYNLQLQGSFSNTVPDATNGVYWYFRNHEFPNARVAATMSKSPIVYSTTSAFLLKGDVVQPAFYSSDASSVLIGSGETYLSFMLPTTIKPTTAFYRLPQA